MCSSDLLHTAYSALREIAVALFQAALADYQYAFVARQMQRAVKPRDARPDDYRVEFFVQIIPALYFICITLHQKLYTCQVICKVFENFSLRAEELIDKITKFYAYYNGGADNMINRKE